MSVLWVLLYVALGVLWLYAWAEIFKKAGYNAWMCLLMIIPAINVIAFLWLAFGTWPVLGRARE